jgi:hypothetical protein
MARFPTGSLPCLNCSKCNFLATYNKTNLDNEYRSFSYLLVFSTDQTVY